MHKRNSNFRFYIYGLYEQLKCANHFNLVVKMSLVFDVKQNKPSNHFEGNVLEGSGLHSTDIPTVHCRIKIYAHLTSHMQSNIPEDKHK